MSNVALMAVPSAVATLIFPVTAPAGIVNVTSAAVDVTTVAATVPTFTTGGFAAAA